MVKVFICDDNEDERRKIEGNLLSYISTHSNTRIDYDIYSSPVEMLERMEKTSPPDIVLLDIYMPGMRGIECARSIQKLGNKTDIIFLTTSSDFALDAFSVHASDYLTKPFSQEKFNLSLDRVMEKRGTKNWILLSSEGRIHRVALEDIIYIETDDKKRMFTLINGLKLQSWLSPAEVEAQVLVGKGLIKCGSSYIVNLAHIKCFSKNNLIMENGAVIPVPRRFKTYIKDEYFSYYTGEARRRAGN